MNAPQISGPKGSDEASRITELAEKLSTALERWLVPGGRVAIHAAVAEPDAFVDSYRIWARGPRDAWSVREVVDVDGVSQLDLELAVVEAGFAFPISGHATGRWQIDDDANGGALARVLEVRYPWS
ncbi:hypothetical protein [Myceligenerans crystallogenes]|uniref:Uncharacterized protein n=1 Tax=Myceligenerans crystallogenes TaxID=316335 RepID=A0ABP4ZYR1_9MICO